MFCVLRQTQLSLWCQIKKEKFLPNFLQEMKKMNSLVDVLAIIEKVEPKNSFAITTKWNKLRWFCLTYVWISSQNKSKDQQKLPSFGYSYLDTAFCENVCNKRFSWGWVAYIAQVRKLLGEIGRQVNSSHSTSPWAAKFLGKTKRPSPESQSCQKLPN